MRSSRLLASTKAGHSLSHDVCPCTLQLAHQYLSLSASTHSAVQCSLPHVLQMLGQFHVAGRWLAPRDWHFKHLFSSLHILLAHVLLPDTTMPTCITQFAASVVWNCAIMCATFWPGECLCSGLIHLVHMLLWWQLACPLPYPSHTRSAYSLPMHQDCEISACTLVSPRPLSP